MVSQEQHGWATIVGLIIIVLLAIWALFPRDSIPKEWVGQPKEYKDTTFQGYVLTDMGKFVIYHTDTVTLNIRWFKNQKSRTFLASALSIVYNETRNGIQGEIWYTTLESFQREVKNIESQCAFNKAVMRDYWYEAEWRAYKLKQWVESWKWQAGGKGLKE